jgi:hypothetical protein
MKSLSNDKELYIAMVGNLVSKMCAVTLGQYGSLMYNYEFKE